MTQPDPYLSAREAMVHHQIFQRGVKDPRLLEAFRRVPRHSFVPPESRRDAYLDHPLPIGFGQTISQPYIVAAMTALLALVGHERVLEIGTGSGYQAAILAELARDVYTVERFPELAQIARETLADLGYQNVHVHTGDGSQGLAEFAPYDAILVTAAAPEVPRTLIDQVTEGGRLVIPVGGSGGQDLKRLQKQHDRMVVEQIFPVAFVPLRGRFGWQSDEWL